MVRATNPRLIEAYQAEVISLEKLSGQRKALAERRRLAEQQQERQLRHASRSSGPKRRSPAWLRSVSALAPDCKLPISPSGRPS